MPKLHCCSYAEVGCAQTAHLTNSYNKNPVLVKEVNPVPVHQVILDGLFQSNQHRNGGQSHPNHLMVLESLSKFPSEALHPPGAGAVFSPKFPRFGLENCSQRSAFWDLTEMPAESPIFSAPTGQHRWVQACRLDRTHQHPPARCALGRCVQHRWAQACRPDRTHLPQTFNLAPMMLAGP